MGVPKPQLRQAYRLLPDLLRELREQASLTQRQLAQKLKVAQNTVHRMEIGSRRCDAIELIAWARACGASPRTVFDRLVRRVER